MISPTNMTQFAGVKKFNKHVLTEYYQYELLDSIYQQKGSEHLCFHGGTAIRIVYGSRRFSEDLDFDTDKIMIFDSLLREVVKDMESKGFDIEFRLIHKDAYHCHIKFPHVLKELGLSGYGEEKLLIKVDAAPVRHLTANPALLNNYAIFRNINVSPKDIILAKKLITIESRHRPKGRDLYDVTWLWGMTTPSLQYIKQTAKIDLKTLLTQVFDYTKKLDLNQLASETTRFLVNPGDINRILQFPEFIKQELTKLSENNR